MPVSRFVAKQYVTNSFTLICNRIFIHNRASEMLSIVLDSKGEKRGF
jgi:hypothetical protein